MTSFMLKVIALITMTIDHFSILVLEDFSGILRVIGRIAFPIFAFQLVEGYVHTSNKYKHFMLLLIFGIISQIPFGMAFYPYLADKSLNIFFTLLLGFMAMYCYDSFKLWLSTKKSNFIKKHSHIFSIVAMIPFIILGELFHVDYGYWGVLVICVFYLFRDCKKTLLLPLAYLIICIIKYYKVIFTNNILTLNFANFITTYLTILIIAMYNGKQGKKVKYLFYIYYPLHILILYLI